MFRPRAWFRSAHRKPFRSKPAALKLESLEHRLVPNGAPITQPMFAVGAPDQPLELHVLDVASDPDGDQLQLEVVHATVGTAIVHNKGTPNLQDDFLLYTPPSGFRGH